MDIGSLTGSVGITDNLSDSLTVAAGNVKSFADQFDGLGSKIADGIEHPMDTAKESVVSMITELGPVGVGIVAVGTVAIATGTALFELANNAAKAGEGVLQFSRVTGTAVEDIGAISASATIAGGSLDGFQGMLTQMQRRLDATGPAADKLDAALASINIDATAFRQADPSDRIGMLSEGMNNAAAGTNLMSVALATMGRGGVQNLGTIMQYTDDVRQKGEELGATWDGVTVKAAEDLGQATRTTGVELSTLSTTIGVALIPAVTVAVDGFNRTILALEHIADLGGLVSGGWHMITDALGETALAEETFKATQEAVNNLWVDAAKRGLDLNDATYDVANSMLTAGYSIKTVAEQTGLAVTEVKALKSAMDDGKTAADQYAALWDRLNTALSAGAPNIDSVSASTKGLVIDMKSGGASIADIVAGMADYGLTAGQVALIISTTDAAQKTAEKSARDYAAAMDNLSAVGTSWQATLAGMNQGLVDDVKQMLAAGVSAKDLETAWGILPPQMKAIQDSIKAGTEELKLQADQVKAMGSLWDQYAAEVAKDTASSTYDTAGAVIEAWYQKESNTLTAKLMSDLAANKDNSAQIVADYQEQADILAKTDDQKWAHLNLNTIQANTTSKAYYDQQASLAQAEYATALTMADTMTDAQLTALKTQADALTIAAGNWTRYAGAGQAATLTVMSGMNTVTDGIQTLGTTATTTLSGVAANAIGSVQKVAQVVTQAIADAQIAANLAINSTTTAATQTSWSAGALTNNPAAAAALAGVMQRVWGSIGSNETVGPEEYAMLGHEVTVQMANLGFQGYETGGPVPSTGPIIAHGGEYVIPVGGALVSKGGGGDTNNFYFSYPLGTPDVIAKVVGDALETRQRRLGIRQPTGVAQ